MSDHICNLSCKHPDAVIPKKSYDIVAARERQTLRSPPALRTFDVPWGRAERDLEEALNAFEETTRLLEDANYRIPKLVKRNEKLSRENEYLSKGQTFYEHVAEHRGQSEPHVFCPICNVTLEDMIPPLLGDENDQFS